MYTKIKDKATEKVKPSTFGYKRNNLHRQLAEGIKHQWSLVGNKQYQAIPLLNHTSLDQKHQGKVGVIE